MAPRSKHPPTISGREAARRLNIPVRRLIQLESRANIHRVNKRVPPLKRRYTYQEFKKMERVLTPRSSPNPILILAFLLIMVGIYTSIFSGKSEDKPIADRAVSTPNKPPPPPAKLKKGIQVLRRGKVKEARNIFQSIMYCGDPEIEEQAQYYYLKSFKQSIPMYTKLIKNFIERFPKAKITSQLINVLALIYFKDDKLDDAKKYYKLMVDNYPENSLTPGAMMKIVQIEIKEGNLKEAVQNAELLYFNYPKSEYTPRALYMAAMLLDGRLNQHMAALNLLQKLKREYPKYNTLIIKSKINELTQDWNNNGIIRALELDNGKSDGEDPNNKP